MCCSPFGQCYFLSKRYPHKILLEVLFDPFVWYHLHKFLYKSSMVANCPIHNQLKILILQRDFFLKILWIDHYLDNNCCCKIFVHYLILGRKVPHYLKDVWLNDVCLEYHLLNLLRKYFHSCSMWTIGPIHSLLKYFFRSRIYDWKVISICSSFVRVVKNTNDNECM